MICCCALAGTAACKNCNRRAEFEYPQYIIDYSKTNPLILQDNSSKIAALEHAIKILNDKIDMLLKTQELSNKNSVGVSSDDFPEKPYEGQYWTVGDKIFRYLDDIWAYIGDVKEYDR